MSVTDWTLLLGRKKLRRARFEASPRRLVLPSPCVPMFAVCQEKGLVAPRSSHEDAVLDVKVTELPIKMLLSASRDGAVKIWR